MKHVKERVFSHYHVAHAALSEILTDANAATDVLDALATAGFVVVPREPTRAMVDAALRSTSAWLAIEGSQLTVNREKMRIRYRAMLNAANS